MEPFHVELLKYILRSFFATGISATTYNMLKEESNGALILLAAILVVIGAFGWWNTSNKKQ